MKAFARTAILLTYAVAVAVFSKASIVRADTNDFQGWFQATGLVSLDQAKKYQLFLEVQPRMGADWQRFDRLFIRPALTYNLRQGFSASFGYAWTPGFLDLELHRDFRSEQRLWQQLLFRHDAGRWQWQHRLRPEQRFIQGTEGVSTRLRHSTRGSYGFDPEGSYGLTGFNEFFVTLNSIDNGPQAGYDRNRVFVGPFWRDSAVRYEVGYILEHVHRFGGEERWVHALWSALAFEL
jgi:hypothetical protein